MEEYDLVVRLPHGLGLYRVLKDEKYLIPKDFAILYSVMSADAQSRNDTEILAMRKEAIRRGGEEKR